ncbi:hypothetical protein ABT086_42710, partial [Streptomyces mirabilis]
PQPHPGASDGRSRPGEPDGRSHPGAPDDRPRHDPAGRPHPGTVVDAVVDTDHARRPAVDRAERLSPPLSGRPSLR